MRVTTTRQPMTFCSVCREPMPVGTPGVNFSIAFGMIGRAHVECYKRRRDDKVRSPRI